MKRSLLFVTVLVVLLLTACGRKDALQTRQAPPVPPIQNELKKESAEAVLPEAAPEVPPETAAAEQPAEMQKEPAKPASQQGDGYTIGIPAEGWRIDDRDRDDGVFETVWESTVNRDTEIAVLSMGSRTLKEAQRWLKAEENDFVFQENGEDGLRGVDREDREVLTVRFHGTDSARYAVVWACPEATEQDVGSQLTAIADTFEITKS